MFVKNLLDKALHKQHELISAHDASKKKSTEIDVQIAVHYGTPYTASTMAFDPIQRLLAIGTLDGRIKIIGGDNIEGLLISPKKVPYKHLEFLQNRGFLVAITNENEVQVWNLEFRQLFCSSQWETNITAFAVVPGTSFIFLGDENGLFSVLKYDLEDGKIITMPYHIPLDSLAEKTGIPSLDPQSIVGILPQPNTFGTRVLIAYQKSLLVLWDITENNAIAIRGNGDLRLKQNNFPASELAEAPEEEENQEEEEEICSLCWASSTGSIAAVGYTTGDIYLWNLSPNKNFSHKGKETENMSNTALKLQLASGDRRLPVIVLHWSPSLRGEGDRGGHLFIYGGDEMGSEEVLTVLTIEFPTGLESLRLITRVDLHLNGSFADMILIPDSVAPERTPSSALFVLTNPGQLTIYDCTHFSTKKSEDGESCALDEKFPVLVPTVDPNITVTKLCSISTKVLKKFHATKVGRPPLSGGTKWPLTGGVPSEMSLSKERLIERMYIAGYKDGSVRIWDSTFPILELMFVLNGKLAGMGVGGENVSVSALGFCSVTITLAVGDECGLVRVYKLHENVDNEGHMSYHTKAIQCDAAAMVSNSPIRTLNFTKMGQFLSVGFENGQVAMLEVSNLSAIFCTDFSPETSSSVVSLLECATPGVLSPVEGPKLPKELLISLTKDARLSVLDALTGHLVSVLVLCEKSEVTAISVYALDVNGKEAKGISSGSHKSHETEIQASTVQNSNSDELSSSDDLAVDQLLLICCGNMLLLHSLSQILKGLDKHLKKIELPEHCCWSALYRNIEKKSFDLLLVYQNGSMEIRSVPDLELVGQNSLMSILRWSFKTNMDKTMSSSDGQISLLNGSELAIISLLTSQNSFRIPESAPCLHDKVLAAAVEAAISASVNQKRKQEQVPGILGGIVKGLKGGRGDNSPKFTDEHQLEALLSTIPFSESLDALDVEEINIDDIIIDDVEIDEPMGCGPSSMQKVEKQKKSDNEREKLFEGSSDVPKPRMRTQQEILTKYKYGGDASAAAAHAKEKLMQRQEKLDRISQRTAELQDGAENFANLANELVKNMEKKKWWNI
ncbi:transducin family protein / WD-40 repeat family protein isoform X1 [Carex rostrata]